jgi:hypothetical protein
MACVGLDSVNFFWRQSEGGTDSGSCISGGNHCHSLREGLCRQKKIHWLDWVGAVTYDVWVPTEASYEDVEHFFQGYNLSSISITIK